MQIDSCLLGAALLCGITTIFGFVAGVFFVWWFETASDPNRRGPVV